MNASEANYLSRADHLIQDLEDGNISVDDRKELMEMMRQHYSVRELYLKHTEMVALLKESSETRAELGTMPVSEALLQTQRRKSAMVSFIYSIAALLVIVIGLFAFQKAKQTPLQNTDIVMQSSNDAIFSVTPATKGDGNAKSNPEVTLKIGDQLSIDQGLIQLKLPSGVEALIEGPSELELLSENKIKLDGGMAWFRVAESGHGFTVQTDKADIIDLGTEFGVRFDNSDNIQVHVSKGNVRVEPKLKTSPPIELNANKAIIIDSSEVVTEMDYETSLFRKKFTRPIPYLHWSFDELKNGSFAAKGNMGGVDSYPAKVRHLRGKVQQDELVKSLVKGRNGQAFSMDGGGVFAESMFPGVGGNTPRTVAMWVRHRGSNTARGALTAYCAWGTREPGRLWKILIQDEPTESLLTGTMSSGKSSALRNPSTNKWIHITSVFTGQMTDKGFPEIIHYINGELQQTQPVNTGYKLDTDITTKNSKPLRIGAALEAIKGDSTIDGDIDELFIIRGVMSQEQVQKLMNTNRLDL